MRRLAALPVLSAATRLVTLFYLSNYTPLGCILESSIYPAWRAPNPEPYTERIPSPACGGRWPQAGRGNIKPAFIPLGGHPQTQHLSRLAAIRKPSIYPAWRLPKTQCLSRLAVARKPSVYPAWQPPTNPAFIPLGSHPQTQHLSCLAAAREASVHPA